MVAECEAVLLGREAIHGTANASALASFVRSLTKTKNAAEVRRRYVLRCGKDNGVEMIPFPRTDDEGFESDEDLTSLGSCDDASCSSMYVMDHAMKVNRNRQQKSSSHGSGAEPIIATGSVSSVGTDSANSSGGSDNDDSEISVGHIKNDDARYKQADHPCANGEAYQFHEIAFCHTDPSLPRIIVWVVKTKMKKKSAHAKSAEYSYGLEAIVFACRSEDKFRALCKHFQELSRRCKLERPVRCQPRSKESANYDCRGHSLIFSSIPQSKKPDTKRHDDQVKENTYNLIQRVDTDGVTHIEVCRPQTEVNYLSTTILTDTLEPSSIISINTPESGNIHSLPKVSEKQIESVIFTEDVPRTAESIPQRPERKARKSYGKDKAPPPPPQQEQKLTNQEKVVRGQYVRVSVDQKSLSSSPSGWLFSNEARPCGNALSYPNSLAWSSKERTSEETLRKTRRSQQTRSGNYRSKSTSGKRSESPKRHHPMSHRYGDALPVNNSLPNRFFGKLKELTIGSNNSGHKFKRRNSIGDLANAQLYQRVENRLWQQNNGALAKSTPNLKSVIKNKNGKYPKDRASENVEPKKVTFSAYATVQVVD